MPIYQPPARSKLPLAPVWAALGRHNYGVELYDDGTTWVLTIERLVRTRDGWAKQHVATVRHEDELDILAAALPDLPGIRVRLAMISLLLGI